MATNMVYRYDGEKTRSRALSTIVNPSTTPTVIQSGVPVIFGDGPAVSLTASGNATVTKSTNLPGGLTSVTYGNGGVGNSASPASASFAFDGSWDLAVTGATTSTASGVKVYMIPATGVLTLTAGTNIPFGFTDYPEGFAKVAGRAVVKIGA